MSRVEIQPYDPEWPRMFERIRDHVWPAVQIAALSLEHVGSTAVPGLSAKPVIDACIIVASRRDLPHVVKGLAKIGYVHRGNLGIPDRESFRHPPDLPRHHLYASPRGSVSVKNHLGFRDHLRTHPQAMHAYAELKTRLAAQFPHDMDGYIAGKTDFIVDILRQVGLSDDELEVIRGASRPQDSSVSAPTLSDRAPNRAR